MEASAPKSAPNPAVGEKALDTVLSLLETVRCLTSIATIGYQSDERQNLAVESGPTQTNNKTLESDEQGRIAILEKELKQERAAKDDTLSSLQRVLQLYGPSTIEYPRQSSASFEKADEIKNLQQRLNELNETKEENEQLKGRFLSATRQKTGYVEPHSVPETPKRLERLDRDTHLSVSTSSGDPFIGQAPRSPFNIKSIPESDDQDVDIRGVQDHLQEAPHDFSTSRKSPADDQILADIAEYDFRSLEDILAEDDPFETAAQKGLRNLESVTGSAAVYNNAPRILETGLDPGRVRFANETYTLEHVDRSYGRRYDERRPHGFSMDRHEPASGGENSFRAHRAGVVPGDNPSPDYFKYGLHYNPLSNMFRTVHIGNLPLSITISQLISRVRGGQIISATICDSAKLTGSMSALVVFLNPDEAAEYAHFSKSHAIVFDSRPAIVTLLKTSTWPLSKPFCRRIIDQGQTRCLSIFFFVKTGLSRKSLVRKSRDLQRQLYRDKLYRAYRRSSLDRMSLDNDGVIHISFSSVHAAVQAFDILRNPRNYRTCTISFEKDPCSRSLDDLLAPVGPRTDEAREIIPTDGDDLGDIDDDELTDVDAEDLNYRRTARHRYRDVDKSPAGTVDELSYSDANNVTVPQFGGPLIQLKDSKMVSTFRRLPNRPDSQGPRRRSWADEINGDEGGEEHMEPLISIDLLIEEDVVPIIPTVEITVEEVDAATKTAVMNASMGKGQAEIIEIPISTVANTAPPTPNVDVRVDHSKDFTIISRSKPKSFPSEYQIQADNGTVIAKTPTSSFREEELDLISSSSEVTAPVLPLLKETTPPTMPKTARHSLGAEAATPESKEPTNGIREVAAITSAIKTAQLLPPRMAVSSVGKPKDMEILTAIAQDIVSTAQNPDEIDLGLDLDSSSILTASASKLAANVDIMEIKPSTTLPLVPLPTPASTSTSITVPGLKPKTYISGSILGPSNTTLTSAIGGLPINPKKNFKGSGLLTSKYATSRPSSENTSADTGTGTSTAPGLETENKNPMILKHSRGVEKEDGGRASSGKEDQGEKRGHDITRAEITSRGLESGITSTKSFNDTPVPSLIRGRKLVRYGDEDEEEMAKLKAETKNQVLSTTGRSVPAKSGSGSGNGALPTLTRLSTSLFPAAAATTDATAVAAPSSAAAVPPSDVTASLPASIPSVSSPATAVPAASTTASSPVKDDLALSFISSPSLGSSGDGDLAADSGSEGC